MDVIYRFDPRFEPPATPGTPAEAVARLRRGNEELARLASMYGKAEASLSDYEKGIKGAGLSEKARTKKIF